MRKTRRFGSGLCAAILGVALTALAQDAAELKQTTDEMIAIRRGTQEARDDWATERTQLRTRLRAARSAAERLDGQVAAAEQKLAAVTGRTAELQRRLEESRRLEASLEDTLGVMLARLQARIARDLPFLPQERATRLAGITAELARPETAPSEKLRRLLEVLQIEALYGGTVEVYPDRISVDGDSLYADILRVGRLSLFWCTPDGGRAGEYARDLEEWIELSAGERRAIRRAIEMATRQRPMELIALPLGRITP